MGLIDITIDRGGGGNTYIIGDVFAVKVGKTKGLYLVDYLYERSYSSVTSGGLSVFGFSVTKARDGFIVRSTQNFPAGGVANTAHIIIRGNFNYDEIEIIDLSEFSRRVEVRNEFGVLITDNGLPRGSGTFPPDAKNRAGLAGLHAAPAVINPELEAALTGDATNKEEKLTGAERGAGVQYVLERNDDNGL